MSWIRRHFYFLLSSFATVGLLIAAFVYALAGYMANRRAFERLDGALVELKRLCELDPHPGTEKVNNIEIAREQQKQLREYIAKAAERFVPIPPIPNSPEITTEEFIAQLNRTIDQLQREATTAHGVALPPKYNFTFETIKRRVSFSTNSLPLLAAQLGEVKAICDVLFRARIHALDNLRRERVCPEDSPETAPTDYLDRQSVTNELAVLTPYEVTFRCFSEELARVLGGFANAPYCFIIKHIDIGPAGPSVTPEGSYGPEGYGPYIPGAGPGYPGRVVPPEETYRPVPQPYGRPPYAGTPYGWETDRGIPTPTPVPTVPGAKPGPQPALDESMFKVVLRIDVVKLNLPK